MELKDYLNIEYPFELLPDPFDGGYVIKYPDLPGCISQGETIEEAFKMGLEAKRIWIESELEDNKTIPLPSYDKSIPPYSGEYKIRMPKELHRELIQNAKKQGVSLNQYCIYLLTKNSALPNA